MVEQFDYLPIGYKLLEYEFQELLGRGGFGITYLAIDLNLNKKVAIKEYFPKEFANREAGHTIRPSGNKEDRDTFEWGLKRFLDEARTLALFEDPNIISVKRFFEANGTAYLVMDYCDGFSLDEIIKRDGPLDQKRLLFILEPLLSSLQRIHAANFLHRDVKPANIYIRENGAPILLDFGSARQHVSSHSRTVTSLATAGYAALEQYSTSSNQGPALDIYGLAATLYRAITGEKPQDALDRVLEDRLIPLGQKGVRGFDINLLKAIDAGMGLRPESRPKDISTWMSIFGASISANQMPIKSVFSLPSGEYKNAPITHTKRNLVIFLIPGLLATLLVLILATQDINFFASKEVSTPVVPSDIPTIAKKADLEIKGEVKPLKPSTNAPIANLRNKSVVATVRKVSPGLYTEIDILPYSNVRVGDVVMAENGNTYKIYQLSGSLGSIVSQSTPNPKELKSGMQLYGDAFLNKGSSGTAEEQVRPIQTRLELVANVTNIIYNYNYAEISFISYANVRVGDVLTDGRNSSYRIEKISGSLGSIVPIGGSNINSLEPRAKLYSRGGQ
jgi:serine/threonine protein kinase